MSRRLFGLRNATMGLAGNALAVIGLDLRMGKLFSMMLGRDLSDGW